MSKKLTTAEFNKLPKYKKAILVAKDVIEQIKVRRYNPKTDSYIKYVETVDNEPIEGQINKNFDKIESCNCCALGSMLLSCTHLGNKLSTNDIHIGYIGLHELRNTKVRKLFNSIFDSHILLLLETAFEGYTPWEGCELNYIRKNEKEDFVYYDSADRYASDIENKELSFEETYKCEKFKRKYKSDKNRLIAICNNLIKNKGKLVL